MHKNYTFFIHKIMHKSLINPTENNLYIYACITRNLCKDFPLTKYEMPGCYA